MSLPDYLHSAKTDPFPRSQKDSIIEAIHYSNLTPYQRTRIDALFQAMVDLPNDLYLEVDPAKGEVTVWKEASSSHSELFATLKLKRITGIQ